MKRLFAVILALLLVSIATYSYAKSVRGYTKKSGTYVSSYNKSSPNNTVRDNYSYKGNANIYTGKTGTDKYKNSPTSEYYQPTGLKK